MCLVWFKIKTDDSVIIVQFIIGIYDDSDIAVGNAAVVVTDDAGISAGRFDTVKPAC